MTRTAAKRRNHGRRLVVLARYDRRVRLIIVAFSLTLCGLLVSFLSSRNGGGRFVFRRKPTFASSSSRARRLDQKARDSNGAAAGGADVMRGPNATGGANSRRDGDPRRSNGGGEDCESYGCPLRPYDVADWPSPTGSVGTDDESRRRRRRRWCGATQRGNQHPHNQDRAVVISPFRRHDPENEDGETGDDDDLDDFFIGIFDGHGDQGHIIAEHIFRDLPHRISVKLDKLRASSGRRTAPGEEEEDEELDLEDVKKVLTESFLECDAAAPAPAALDGGSTASIVLRLGRRRIYTANVGDSLSFVGLVGTTIGGDGGGGAVASADIVNRTARHKPHLPSEKARIESMGGHVHVPPPPKNPAMARAVVYNSFRGEQVGLAMSRSLGDWEHGAAGVIAEPTVEVLDVESLRRGRGGGGGRLFAVSVSDGVTDSRKPELVANKLAKYLFADGEGVKDGCLDVIEVATPKNTNWYRDDMTVVAVVV